MMTKSNTSDHGKADKKSMLLFTCTGTVNVSEIAGRAARQLVAQGHGSMFNLAGLGGDGKSSTEDADQAKEYIVIDGCPLDCGSNMIESVGVTAFRHIRVTELGIEKDTEAKATDEQVRKVVDHVIAGKQSNSA
jgi:uncharacterized metal-binding protein